MKRPLVSHRLEQASPYERRFRIFNQWQFWRILAAKGFLLSECRGSRQLLCDALVFDCFVSCGLNR